MSASSPMDSLGPLCTERRLYCTGVPLARQVAGFPSSEDRIMADWSAQNALRPNVFALGAAVRRKVVAGVPPQPDSVNTNPYRLPLARPLSISIAWCSFRSPPPNPSRFDNVQ